MLERGLHQGTGLLQNRPWARTRVAAVATAPDAASLDTLWRLCALLQSEGTSVVVLDASVPEHEANPGLEQLLTSTSLCTLPSAPIRLDDGAPGSLAVLPAARGLQQLSTQAQPGTLCSLYQTCDTTGTPLARLLPMLRAIARPIQAAVLTPDPKQPRLNSTLWSSGICPQVGTILRVTATNPRQKNSVWTVPICGNLWVIRRSRRCCILLS